MPLIAPVEVMGTRETMCRLLSYLHHPFLVLRFGTTEPPTEPRLTRLKPRDFLSTIDWHR